MISPLIKDTIIKDFAACPASKPLTALTNILKKATCEELQARETATAFLPHVKRIYIDGVIHDEQVKKTFKTFFSYLPQVAVKTASHTFSLSMLELQAQSDVLVGLSAYPGAESTEIDLSHRSDDDGCLFYKMLAHEEVDADTIYANREKILHWANMYGIASFNSTLCTVIESKLATIEIPVVAGFYRFAKETHNLRLFTAIKKYSASLDAGSEKRNQFLQSIAQTEKEYEEDGGKHLFRKHTHPSMSQISFENNRCHMRISSVEDWAWFKPQLQAQDMSYDIPLCLTFYLKTSRFGGTCSEDVTEYHFRRNADDIGRVLQEQKHLVSLNVRENRIDDTTVYALLWAIASNQDLQVLNLSNNRIEDGINALATFLKNNASLEQLHLENYGSWNERDRPNRTDFTQFAVALKQHPSLQVLNLCSNNIQFTQAQVLAQGIAQSTSLLEVDVSYNDFRGRELATICTSNTVLQKINVRKNGLSDDDLTTITEAIQRSPTKSSSITALNLSDNHFTGPVLVEFLRHFPSLKQLGISDCALKDADIVAIADFIKDNPNFPIESLDVGHVSHEGVIALAHTRKATLKEVKFTGRLTLESLKEIVTNLPNVTKFSLFTFEFPDDFLLSVCDYLLANPTLALESLELVSIYRPGPAVNEKIKEVLSKCPNLKTFKTSFC